MEGRLSVNKLVCNIIRQLGAFEDIAGYPSREDWNDISCRAWRTSQKEGL